MKPLSTKKVNEVLHNHGFMLIRQKGSHMIWKQESTGIIVPVPYRSGAKPLSIGTFLSIVKQSKIPKDQFK